MSLLRAKSASEAKPLIAIPRSRNSPACRTDFATCSDSFCSTNMQMHLAPKERLEILRAADKHRKWYSLDDQRVCVMCDKAITGRQIQITRDQRGRYLLHCPTENCPSAARDWFYHGSACSRPSGSGVKFAEVDFAGM
jgi:hypothetical protein